MFVLDSLTTAILLVEMETARTKASSMIKKTSINKLATDRRLLWLSMYIDTSTRACGL